MDFSEGFKPFCTEKFLHPQNSQRGVQAEDPERERRKKKKKIEKSATAGYLEREREKEKEKEKGVLVQTPLWTQEPDLSEGLSNRGGKKKKQ